MQPFGESCWSSQTRCVNYTLYSMAVVDPNAIKYYVVSSLAVKGGPEQKVNA